MVDKAKAVPLPHSSPIEASPIEARLFVFSDGFIHAASAVSNLQTSRHAGVVLISLDETPISVRFARSDTASIKGRVVALAPGVSRSIGVGSAGALSVHFDPSHPVYFSMVKCLGAQDGMVIPYDYFACLSDELQKCKDGVDADTVRIVFEKCADAIQEFCPYNCDRDKRILELLKDLQHLSPLDYQFSHILNAFNLSASRFSHLFTANAGLSLRSFLQWRKIKEAITMFETGVSMTEIAHASGFSDSAHFCRTFNKCLGLKPSMFGPSRPVKVHVIDQPQRNEYNYA